MLQAYCYLHVLSIIIGYVDGEVISLGTLFCFPRDMFFWCLGGRQPVGKSIYLFM